MKTEQQYNFYTGMRVEPYIIIMKRFHLCIFIILLFITLLAVTSCQKVIKLPATNNEAKYVIQANLSDRNDSLIVWVSKTVSLDNYNYGEAVSNANITILKDGNAIPILLNNSGRGRYATRVPVVQGSDYELRVLIGDSLFTANCTMPKKVTFDSLYISQASVFGKKRNIPTLQFKDPADPGNYYLFTYSVDGFDNTAIFLLSDKLINGRTVYQDLVDYAAEADSTLSIDKYDIVRVEARCIDKSVYEYYYSLLQSATGQPGSASPGNPKSNITGGALGYFSVHSYQLLETIVP